MALEMYQERVLDHYKRPRNFGVLDPHTHTARDTNPLCGDDLSLTLCVEDGHVADVRFQGRGCTVATATASLLTEWLKGRSVDEAMAVDQAFLKAQLGIPVASGRVKCMMLSRHVLRLALGKAEKGKIED